MGDVSGGIGRADADVQALAAWVAASHPHGYARGRRRGIGRALRGGRHWWLRWPGVDLPERLLAGLAWRAAFPSQLLAQGQVLFPKAGGLQAGLDLLFRLGHGRPLGVGP